MLLDGCVKVFSEWLLMSKELLEWLLCGLVSVVLTWWTFGLEEAIREVIEGIYTLSIGIDMFEWSSVDRVRSELKIKRKWEVRFIKTIKAKM